jgi:hypothetical protein
MWESTFPTNQYRVGTSFSRRRQAFLNLGEERNLWVKEVHKTCNITENCPSDLTSESRLLNDCICPL